MLVFKNFLNYLIDIDRLIVIFILLDIKVENEQV